MIRHEVEMMICSKAAGGDDGADGPIGRKGAGLIVIGNAAGVALLSDTLCSVGRGGGGEEPRLKVEANIL